MSAEQFVYWLRGFIAASDSPPTEAQWKAIRDEAEAVYFPARPIQPTAPSVRGGMIALSGNMPVNADAGAAA